VIQTGTIRNVGCGFLFAFRSNYGCVLHHFRDKARYWLKIVMFSCPLHSTPPLGVPVGEWWGYPMVKKLWGYVQPFRQNTGVWRTDRRTDGQTFWHSIVRAMHTRRAVKTIFDITGSRMMPPPCLQIYFRPPVTLTFDLLNPNCCDASGVYQVWVKFVGWFLIWTRLFAKNRQKTNKKEDRQICTEIKALKHNTKTTM